MKYLINTFDIEYSPKLYRVLREINEIQQAKGIERERIIKLAKGDLNKCKEIQFNEYLKN